MPILGSRACRLSRTRRSGGAGAIHGRLPARVPYNRSPAPGWRSCSKPTLAAPGRPHRARSSPRVRNPQTQAPNAPSSPGRVRGPCESRGVARAAAGRAEVRLPAAARRLPPNVRAVPRSARASRARRTRPRRVRRRVAANGQWRARLRAGARTQSGGGRAAPQATRPWSRRRAPRRRRTDRSR